MLLGLGLGAASFLPWAAGQAAGGGAAAELRVESPAGTYRWRLDRNRVERLDGSAGSFVYAVTNGGVCVLETHCPDALCRRQGVIRAAGEAIACVPQRISLRIAGGTRGGAAGGPGVDAVSR